MGAFLRIGWREMRNDSSRGKKRKPLASKRLPSSRKAAKHLVRLERQLLANEERWRAIINNPFMGITVIDENQRFVTTNSIYQAMVGYNNEELKKLTPLDITPPDDREVNRVVFRELQEGKREHFELVKRLQRKDGRLIWIQLYVFKIPKRGLVGPHTFALSFDITEKIEAQAALQVAQAKLARATQMSRIGAMTASIAHEINQPLTAILASAKAGLRWIAQTPPNLDETQDTLNRIVHDCQHAADVVRHTRAMFKFEETARSLVDLNQIINEVLTLLRGEFQRHGILVQTELVELPPVTANRVQVQQVFFNLVTNGIEAMDSVTDRSRLLLIKSGLENSGEVSVTVEDSGTGIDSNHIDQIFSSFFTTKVEGMGMGLSICRSIIEAHRGRLSASRRSPHGSVFQFTLPIG